MRIFTYVIFDGDLVQLLLKASLNINRSSQHPTSSVFFFSQHFQHISLPHNRISRIHRFDSSVTMIIGSRKKKISHSTWCSRSSYMSIEGQSNDFNWVNWWRSYAYTCANQIFSIELTNKWNRQVDQFTKKRKKKYTPIKYELRRRQRHQQTLAVSWRQLDKKKEEKKFVFIRRSKLIIIQSAVCVIFSLVVCIGAVSRCGCEANRVLNSIYS